MNKRQFIEMTVREERSVILRIKDQDEFIRGVSKSMQNSTLIIESEEGGSLQYKISDIIDVFAVKFVAPAQLSIQSHYVQSNDSEDDIENLVHQFHHLSEDDQNQLITRLSHIFEKDVVISTLELKTYSPAEILLLTDIINGYILTLRTPDLYSISNSINMMDLPSNTGGRIILENTDKE
ncbi:hypothetical protein [Paenibacillus sp. 453mf]|uniref:hypothetical protein n=1 Tax=Paenibacillus sp. 453mf TaxID=1761874 RepID=UPI0008EC3373|nr:hypothetical protein [Paenibacillus sp. 453mf]SFS56107.1 hypothetical protein SAMN04488601_1011721 [Paenibacillus sp. 453mf]